MQRLLGEVARNGGRERYRTIAADQAAYRCARRPKVAKLTRSVALRRLVESMLHERWSPQQISARLAKEHPDDLSMRVSHETIYQSLYVQSRGALRKELATNLRTGRVRRRPHGRKAPGGHIRDMVLISERPGEIEDRDVPGHWESDLIFGARSLSAIVTLVERQTRYVMLAKIGRDKTSAHVCRAITEQIKALPQYLRVSLTWDHGKEMAQHAQFTVDTGVRVYFLRSVRSMATRIEREHQRAASPIFSQERRPGRAHAESSRSGCSRTEQPASTDSWLDEAFGEILGAVALID